MGSVFEFEWLDIPEGGELQRSLCFVSFGVSSILPDIGEDFLSVCVPLFLHEEADAFTLCEEAQTAYLQERENRCSVCKGDEIVVYAAMGFDVAEHKRDVAKYRSAGQQAPACLKPKIYLTLIPQLLEKLNHMYLFGYYSTGSSKWVLNISWSGERFVETVGTKPYSLRPHDAAILNGSPDYEGFFDDLLSFVYRQFLNEVKTEDEDA